MKNNSKYTLTYFARCLLAKPIKHMIGMEFLKPKSSKEDCHTASICICMFIDCTDKVQNQVKMNM